MKRIIPAIVIAFLAAVFLFGCKSENTEETAYRQGKLDAVAALCSELGMMADALKSDVGALAKEPVEGKSRQQLYDDLVRGGSHQGRNDGIRHIAAWADSVLCAMKTEIQQ